MISVQKAVITKILCERKGAQELLVSLQGEERKAINYTDLTGIAEVGDTAILNTTAVELLLGTGGYDFVIHLEKVEKKPVTANGHLIKLRYTPMQTAMNPDENDYESSLPETLNGTPVISCALHSQISPICFAIKQMTPQAKIAYVMTDTASLAYGFSRSVSELKDKEYICGSITCGQAFGGDLEAVNLYGGLLLAKAAFNTDVIIACQGPGNTGLGIKWGFSSIDQGLSANAAVSLGGTSVFCVRMSSGDKRERHQGISHHSMTTLKQVVLCDCEIPLPESLPQSEIDKIKSNAPRHKYSIYNTEEHFSALLQSGLSLSTMGRTPEQDRLFYESALSAGMHTAFKLKAIQ